MNSSLIDSYIEDIAKRIHDPALYGAATVMVGAGFSKNADVVDDEISAPNWEELAVLLFETLYHKPISEAEIKKWELQKIKKTSGKNVLKLAEEYKAVFGRKKLNRFIEANINDDMYIPGELHKELLSLNWRDVFTTNYDTLLERTIDKINVKFNYKILTSQTDLPGSTHPRIIKLHGSVDSGKHYIICEEDYRTYPVQFAPLVNTVQQAMLETQLCLIGFSGDDPNFLSWVGWLRDNMGENSPPIYLIGLFQNMSIAEKMTLESQKITVVNLGDMFTGEVGHQEALSSFLSKLTRYGKEKEVVFESVPYNSELHKYDFYKSINEEYFRVMEEFLTRMKNKINGYMAFPNNNEADQFVDYLKKHLVALIKLEPSKSQFSLLSKIVFLLRRGYLILEDFEAEKIQMLIDSIPEEELRTDKALVSNWTEVAIYLLEMFRIDGRNEEYKALLTKIENIPSALDGHTKQELQIEKCKFYISEFDYVQATKEVEKIDHQIALDIHLKKIFLYKQIGEDNKGKDLLRQASALLSQKKYTENKNASLKGYLNLCARALMNGLGEKIDDSFSDKEYNLNVYNVRNIYNQIKNDVSKSLLLVSSEDRGETKSFNPGIYNIIYGTATKKEQDAELNPLKYIIFQDLLCLPNTFSDHSDILALGLKKIIHTSRIPTWKWSAVIRTNDSKIINSFFTRELIISAETKWVEEMFDQLMSLDDEFTSVNLFTIQRKIITQKTLFDVLSRFSIVIDDERVIQLLKKILELRKDANDFDSRDLDNYFRRLGYSLNSKIITHYFNYLLESNSISLDVVFAFSDVKVKIDRSEISDNVMEKVLSEIMSENDNTRRQGIAKAVLIKEVSDFGKYKQKISQALWNKLNSKGVPQATDFNMWAWEELPHPKEIDFNHLYSEYLINPQFIRSVNKGVISGITTIDRPINEYVQLFRRLSSFSKETSSMSGLLWTSKYFSRIIEYIYNYIDNEKSVLDPEMDFFGMSVEGKKRFVILADFVAMLSAQAYYSNVYTEKIQKSVNKVKELLNENEISTASLDLMDKVMSEKLGERDVKHLINRLIVGSRDELRQVVNAIDILLMLESNSINNINISKHLVNLINSLKYFDASRSSSVIYQLINIIDHPLLIKSIYRKKIVDAFRENLDKLDLSINESDRELIESVYSLSILVRRYYDCLIRSEISISKKFASIIKKFSEVNLKEVRYMWEDIQANEDISI